VLQNNSKAYCIVWNQNCASDIIEFNLTLFYMESWESTMTSISLPMAWYFWVCNGVSRRIPNMMNKEKVKYDFRVTKSHMK
jgi:hypothetical protein